MKEDNFFRELFTNSTHHVLDMLSSKVYNKTTEGVMTNFDYIIVGSGISGMSYAHYAAKTGKQVLVIDKKDYAGGCVKSLRHEDFWVELGGHTIYNSYMTFIKTLRELGIEDKFLPPREKAAFKMYKDNAVVPLMSSLSKIEAALNVPKMFFKKKPGGHTVREYYSSVLGNNNYENMFSPPMLQAVISQDASDFPADMLLKKRERDNTAPPRNFTLTGGMAAFIEAVAALENVTVYTETEAVDIAKDGEKYIVETHCGKKYTADNVTLACPPIFAGKLLANIAPPDVSELLNQIPAVKVETVGVIVNKSDVSVDNFSFIIAKDDDFTSAVSRDIIPHDKYRGFAFHFRGGDKLDKEGR